MASPVQESIKAKVELTKNGKPRATRPDGSYYSSDPKVRIRELQEDGKVGGEYGKLGGRPRKVSAQHYVSEKAKEDAEEIYAALKSGLASESAKTRMDSAKTILDIEARQIKLEEREQARREGMDKEALIEALIDKVMSNGPTARMVRERMAAARGEVTDVIDSSATELPSGGPD